MARGWESKSVEAQMEAAAESGGSGPKRSPEEMRRAQQRRALELSRSRVLSSLEKSENPRYRQMLQQALADLDTQLNKLGS
jgi:hypothetical protein